MPKIKFGPRVTCTLVLPKTVCYLGHATVSQASPCTTRPGLGIPHQARLANLYQSPEAKYVVDVQFSTRDS